jgi:hypothetical protein
MKSNRSPTSAGFATNRPPLNIPPAPRDVRWQAVADASVMERARPRPTSPGFLDAPPSDIVGLITPAMAESLPR